MSEFEIPVVMYHSINDSQKAYPLGNLSFFTRELIAHLRYFRDAGFECITLSELLQRALDGKVGHTRLIVLTFDDGFLDNYLVAADILKKFNIKGTLFVNPGHAAVGPARSLEEEPDAWGYLNFEEMRSLERSGIFEIQSHTLSHEDVFLSDRLIDLYSPEKFRLYYWLVWKLFPHIRAEWQGDVTRYRGLIPAGYPIFEYGRSLRGKEFIPSAKFVDQCVQLFQVQGDRCLADLQLYPEKGVFEPEERYAQRVEEQIVQSKQTLERELSKSIECICFPGDISSERLLARAREVGHKVYMRPHWGERWSNLAALKNAQQILDNHQMVGLQRIVFTYGYRGLLPTEPAAYWTAKVSVKAAQGNAFYNGCFSTARLIKRKILKRESKSRLQRREEE
jgi:peptidoglycan/xylan/chitin deacetylase (PgdA/CDA1 family)